MIPNGFLEVQADYAPEIKQGEKLYRYDKMESRYYFTFHDGNAMAYISVTSLANLLLPKGEGFMRWLISKGEDAYKDRAMKASFGTAFHVEALKPLIWNKGYDFNELDKNLYDIVPVDYHHTISDWIYPFKKSLASFFYFVKQRVKKVIAVEIPLASRKDRIACTIDLVAEIEWRKKTYLAIIDLKSMMFSLADTKKKTFYDTHEFQLEINKRIWNENFGDQYPVEYVFNWAPVNFKTDSNPYTLKNQTDNQFVDCIDDYINIAKKRKLVQPPTKIVDIVGSFDSFEDFDINNHLINYKII